MSGSGSFVCSRIWNATLSNVDMSVNSAPNWNSMLIRRRMSNSSIRVQPADVLSEHAHLALRGAQRAADQP